MIKETIFDTKITPLHKLNKPNIVYYYKFLSEVMKDSKTKFVIAGGAVRDELNGDRGYRGIKDIDVFISTKLTELRLNILKKYGTYTIKDTEYAGFYVINFKFHENMGLSFNVPSHIPIQFIYNNDTGDPTAFNTVEDFALFIIRNFDWSINACAFDGKNIIQLVPVGGYSDVLYLVNPKYSPLSALYRGLKFKDRFDMVLDKDSMKLLCRKIADLDEQ